jgi:hypothetical protein
MRRAETCSSIDVGNKELLRSTETRSVILTDKPKEIAPSGSLSIDERIILKWILKTWNRGRDVKKNRLFQDRV